jgi:hypothetical protein
MTPVELQLNTAVQHLVTTARAKAYYKDDYARIAELLDRADHLCNLAREGVADVRLARILDETAMQFPECSRAILTGVTPNS